MKTPALLLAITAIFYISAAAQSTARINFDVRTGSSETANLSGRERPRISNDSVESRMSPRRLEREVFDLLNAERLRQGLTELEWSEDVAAVARLHSNNMADAKFFSHRGTDGSMVDDRADRLGLGSWRTIGENIAYMRGFENPAQLAVEKWMESTAHRKNLLGSNWKESAVGVAVTADGTYYMTQVFLLRK